MVLKKKSAQVAALSPSRIFLIKSAEKNLVQLWRVRITVCPHEKAEVFKTKPQSGTYLHASQSVCRPFSVGV